jgi:CubicO group peptidase (beta-lactamase class C family)
MQSTTLEGSPAHGGVSTVTDLLAFADGISRLLAPETFSRMTTPHLPELVGVLPGWGRQEPNPWGLGPEIRSGKSPHWTGGSNSPFTWGHFGQAGTFLWVDPLANTTLVVLTDLPFGDWAKPRWPALSDAVLG